MFELIDSEGGFDLKVFQEERDDFGIFVSYVNGSDVSFLELGIIIGGGGEDD